MPNAQNSKLPYVTPLVFKRSWKQCTNQSADSLGFSMTNFLLCLIWCMATWAQNRTIGMTFCLSACLSCSVFMLDQRDHGEHRGAMCMISGFWSMMTCMARCCPVLVFKSNPVRRSTGAPTFKPAKAAHWLARAEPAKSSRKSILPAIEHCQCAWEYEVLPSTVNSAASGAEAPSEVGTPEIGTST